MNLYKGAESNSPYKVLGNTPDESSKYPGDDEKWKNGDNFDKNVVKCYTERAVDKRPKIW